MQGNTPTQRARALQTVLNKLYDPYGKEANITDMLTDLRHLCDYKSYDFADCNRIAYTHYVKKHNS